MIPYDTLEMKIREKGIVNAHAHFDRAYTLTKKDMHEVVYRQLEDKWRVVDRYKRMATYDDFLANILNALHHQRKFGVKSCLSFIDIDPVVGHKAINAAVDAKEHAQAYGMEFKIACQTLKGILHPNCRRLIETHLDEGHIDIVGSLPGADPGGEIDHLDIIFKLAKKYNKRVHAHVDQHNTARQKETELLARKAIYHGWEGKVTAIHSISLACHPKPYRKKVYEMARDAGLSFICCPIAWIDHRRTEELNVNHNSITPVDELLEYGLTVALGTDNIYDIYKPFNDGNMMTELRFLIEALHIYDEDILTQIITDNGRKVISDI
tara:strand:- start:17932 stop:18900 length:969 start_codon:yes stop_codon:yes gene_type:complete